MFEIICVLFAVVGSLNAQCAQPLVDSCGITGPCDKTCHNYQIADYCSHVKIACQNGCYCPPGFIQSCDSNFIVSAKLLSLLINIYFFIISKFAFLVAHK